MHRKITARAAGSEALSHLVSFSVYERSRRETTASPRRPRNLALACTHPRAAVLLDTVETLLLRFQSNAAQIASVPASPARRSGRSAISSIDFAIPSRSQGFRWGMVSASIREARISLLLLSLAAIYVCYALRALRWMRFCRWLGQTHFWRCLQRHAGGLHLHVSCLAAPGSRFAPC